MTANHHTILSARQFPNVSAGGYYSPHNLAIRLNIEPPKNGNKGSDERENWFRENLPLIVHEYQHSLDHVGTIVGRKLLDGLRQSYHALDRKLKYDQSGLHRWVKFHELQKRFHRRAYFTENDPTYVTIPGKRPTWSWSTSVGRGFDLEGQPDITNPIIFLRFRDEERDLDIARQPLSAAALFEVRSMAVELEQAVVLNYANFGDDETRWRAFNDVQQSMFYDVDLTLYSAPVHFLSARLNISDPVPAYRLAAILSWIALNIADDLEIDPKLPEGWENAGDDIPTLASNLLLRRDPGYFYFILASHAKTPEKLDGDASAWLAETLECARFPSLSEIVASASHSLDVPDADKDTVPFDRIYWHIAASGAVNFRRLADEFGLLSHNVMTRIGTNKGPIALPNTVVADAILSPSLGGGVEPFMSIEDQARMGELEAVFADQMSEFMAACR